MTPERLPPLHQEMSALADPDLTSLTDGLLRSARLCEETLESYRGDEATTGRTFFSAVMLAVATFERAAASEPDDPSRELSLLIAQTVGREAAQTIRAHGLDPRLLRCSEACERAANLCELALRG